MKKAAPASAIDFIKGVRVWLHGMVSPHDAAIMVAFFPSNASSNLSDQSLGVGGHVETR